MKTLAALFSLLGVLALMTPQMLLHPRSDEAVALAVALNFCLYRNAVNHYVIKHPTTANGILVPKSLLDLPSGCVHGPTDRTAGLYMSGVQSMKMKPAKSWICSTIHMP